MFAAKPIISSSSNQSDLHLPIVSKTSRRQRFRSSPSPSFTSATSATTNMSENVSALKAKYADYAMWLRAASRRNCEPVFTHELLKHSLCQMGIDSAQAEQLVSTCSWYVYQFQKELATDTEQHVRSTTPENKKQKSSAKKRHKKNRSAKSKKSITKRDLSVESVATVNSRSKENLASPGATLSTRHKYTVLPAIHSTDPSISPRSRHVDFDSEQSLKQPKSSHWRSAITKVRTLPKLRPSEIESSIPVGNDISPLELDLSHSQRTFQRPGPGHTRSILRKQISTNSSVTSPDGGHRTNRNRLSTPTSTVIDEIPLGTRSQRLFGGSECFAQIMNELEEQSQNY